MVINEIFRQFLSCPKLQTSIGSDAIEDIGLTSLLASTINNSLPKSKIIKEFEENIQKYKNENITDKDIILLSSRIADGSLNGMEEINKLAADDASQFNQRIREEVRAQEKVNSEMQAQMIDLAERVAKKLEMLNNIEQKKRGELALIQHKEDELSEIRVKLMESDNKLRSMQRKKFIDDRVAKWRGRSWIWTSVIFIVIIGFVILLRNCFGILQIKFYAPLEQ